MKELSGIDIINRLSENIEYWYEVGSNITGCTAQGEDLAHDGLIKLKNSFNDRKAQDAHINGLMYITMKNLYRTRVKKKQDLLIDKEEYQFRASQIKESEKNIIDKKANEIDKVVECCSNDKSESWYYQKLYYYLYIEGISIRELSRLTNINRHTLMQQAAYIRDQIKQKLKI